MKRIIKTTVFITFLILSLTVFFSCENEDNLIWSYENGILEISGDGMMGSYHYPAFSDDIDQRPPWEKHKNDVETVIINDGITEVASYAFYEFINLKSISIPHSVTSIGENAFYQCLKLEDITLPDALTEIYSNAFEDCESLKEIFIPDNVSTIGAGAFSDCSSLTSITVDKTNPYYTSKDGILYTKNYKRLITVPASTSTDIFTVPDKVEIISSDAFFGCYNIEEVVLPSTVTTIGTCAFAKCSALKEIKLPDSIVDIDDFAFADCTSLTECILPSSLEYLPMGMFWGCISFSDTFSIPNTIISVYSSVFDGCESLYYIEIPNSVEYIDESAFDGCDAEIICKKGSYAEQYAIENDIQYYTKEKNTLE